MMNEIFSRYEMQELFLDIFGIQFVAYHSSGRSPFCFCKYTEEAWNNEHPGDPYREGFKTPEGYEARYRWHEKRSMIDILDEIIATARKHRPNALISLNGGPESFPDDIMKKVSFIYAEPITTTYGNFHRLDPDARIWTAVLPGWRIQPVRLSGYVPWLNPAEWRPMR